MQSYYMSLLHVINCTWIQSALCCFVNSVSPMLLREFSQPCAASWIQSALCCFVNSVSPVLLREFSQPCVASWIQSALCCFVNSVSPVLLREFSQPCAASWIQSALCCFVNSVSPVLPLLILWLSPWIIQFSLHLPNTVGIDLFLEWCDWINKTWKWRHLSLMQSIEDHILSSLHQDFMDVRNSQYGLHNFHFSLVAKYAFFGQPCENTPKRGYCWLW